MIYESASHHNNRKADHYDTLVVGSGPAGITLATTLASTGKDIALIEAGGFSYSSRSQEVYEGTSLTI